MVEIVKPEGGLTEERLLNTERLIGVQFPPDYRAFLLSYNGGRPKPAGFEIAWKPDQDCGAHWKSSEVSRFFAIYDGDKANFVSRNEVDFRGRLPDGTIAIAQDPGGNVILLAVGGPFAGKVLFWVKDHEVEEGGIPGYDNVGVIADSFDDFLNTKLR